jgi:hypothetical protein
MEVTVAATTVPFGVPEPSAGIASQPINKCEGRVVFACLRPFCPYTQALSYAQSPASQTV